MEREILFRGKTIDGGEWVYGYFVKRPDMFLPGIEKGFILRTDEDSLSMWDLVDTSTVGQYTGLTDKNGQKIFEGDIISYYGSRETVYFDTSQRIPCFTTGIGRGSSTAPHPYKLSMRHVVIGNIHDNPELLEVQR